MTTRFGVTRMDTVLNTSAMWRGKYWDNAGRHAETPWNPSLQDEIDRFQIEVKRFHKERDLFTLLTPMGLWLKWHNFSEEFQKECLTPVLSLLFVTKMGMAKQSAGATLSYFAKKA